MKPKHPYCHSRTAKGKTSFGDRLKQERLRRGFGLREFADLVGISHTQVTGTENRGVLPRLDTLIAMAEVLDCSLDFLAGLEAA
jgi:transcriptional regulator with XRE-family HTH domain